MKRRLQLIFLTLIVLPLSAKFGMAGELEDRLSKGNQLVKDRLYKEAAREYELALKVDPSNTSVYLLLGLTYAQVGNLEKALDYTQKAVEMDPGYASYYNLGLIHASRQEPDQAIEAFNQALSYSPKAYLVEYQKGLVYASKNDFQNATESYQKAIQLNPYFDDAYLALGLAYYQQGDQSSALKQVEALRKKGNTPLANALEQKITEVKAAL